MLKRFTVENFSSFRDESIFDLTSGRTEVNSNHVVDFENTKILKSAVIYGANAAGKSNLIKAINYAKHIITIGISRLDIYKKYFRLDPTCISKPSLFEFEVELDQSFYSYGFSISINKMHIEEEWLYEIGKSTPKMIFERKENQINIGKDIQKSSAISRFNIYIDDMKNQKDQLFLSEISKKELDIEEAKIFNRIFTWFNSKLIILYPNSKFGGIASLNDNKDLLSIYKKHLCQFDTGILDFKTIEEDFEKNFKGFPPQLKEDIISQMAKTSTAKMVLNTSEGDLLTIYQDENKELKVEKIGLLHSKEIEEVFELKDESDGTRRLFDLIPLIAKFPDDFTILIDEFDRSLHPKLTKNFFKLFYSLNNSKTQLIVTTHESTLLDLTLVRRDEIWFVEKDKHGSSKLYSLNQFKVRYDTKVDKAYLLGRYGGIPIFRTFQNIDEEE